MSEKLAARTSETPAFKVRSQRNRTILVADCRRASGEAHRIRVRDISTSGLRGSCPEVADFMPGETVEIVFPHLAPVRASIARVGKGELGISFLHPVDLEQVARARADAARIAPNPRAEWVADWIGRASREREAEGSGAGT